jgi:molybdenum cofactor guanylyltransferase
MSTSAKSAQQNLGPDGSRPPKKKRSKRSFLFHPQEFSIAGASGSGKTTLLEQIFTLLQKHHPSHRTGFVKHDAHRFAMDRPGKDTYRMKQAGAYSILINDADRHACLGQGEEIEHLSPFAFADCDFVLLEGYRQEARLPKAIMIDGLQKDAPHENVQLAITAQSQFVGQALADCRDATGSSMAALVKDRADQIPVFHRDDAQGILDYILSIMNAKLLQRPLHGLVLTGGASTRMGKDKAALAYHGRSQTEHAVELLRPFCQDVFVSSRAEQASTAARASFPQIHDRFLDFGPTSGILSAMVEKPESAWLVLGCDLPFVTPETLATLVQNRDPWKLATAFASAHDQLPEPLCTIYEPRGRQRFLQFMALGLTCPRKVLIQSTIKSLPLPDPRWLANINHPDEFQAALTATSNGTESTGSKLCNDQ